MIVQSSASARLMSGYMKAPRVLWLAWLFWNGMLHSGVIPQGSLFSPLLEMGVSWVLLLKVRAFMPNNHEARARAMSKWHTKILNGEEFWYYQNWIYWLFHYRTICVFMGMHSNWSLHLWMLNLWCLPDGRFAEGDQGAHRGHWLN